MSQSSPGQTPTHASAPQASSQALLDELRVAADRARDERLKLARLFKHTNELPVNGSAPINANANTTVAAPIMPDARIHEVAQQVERLEQAVADKLEALDQVQQDIESRSQYLESLRHTITDTTRAFVTQVEQAQHFKAHVDAAKQHVKMSAGRVVEDIREHLSEYEAPIAERLQQLTELDEQIDKRIARMQQMHKQASEAVDKHLLGALRAAKEQATEIAAPVKADLDKHLEARRAQIEHAIQDKIASLDVDVEVALAPLTNRFDEIVTAAQSKAEALAQALPAKLEAQAEQQMDRLRDLLAKQAEEIVAGMDRKALEQAEMAMRERVAEALDKYLGEAEKDAGGYVDGLITKLDEARKSTLEQFEEDRKAALDKFEVTLEEAIEAGTIDHADDIKRLDAEVKRLHDEAQQRIDSAQRQVREIAEAGSIDQEAALKRLDDEVQRLHAQAQQRVAAAQKVLEEAADAIPGRASAVVDQAIKETNQRLAEHQDAMSDRLQQVDDILEDGIEQSRQRIIEHEKTAQRQADEAMRHVDSGIAAAQQRLAGFEAGISQRIGLAIQSADGAIHSVDSRLDELEQDASARVGRIVDLAQSSGQAVADSIDALAKSAEATAAKAQQDLEAKLAAFEEISADALKQAEQTLRGNIGELRDASRAMIEVVSKQVKAQASHIEPQTREVIEQAEQTLRRRIAELREGAQSMVDLAVARLESQLDEVKRKAQRTAFHGVQGEDGQQPPATDAA